MQMQPEVADQAGGVAEVVVLRRHGPQPALQVLQRHNLVVRQLMLRLQRGGVGVMCGGIAGTEKLGSSFPVWEAIRRVRHGTRQSQNKIIIDNSLMKWILH